MKFSTTINRLVLLTFICVSIFLCPHIYSQKKTNFKHLSANINNDYHRINQVVEDDSGSFWMLSSTKLITYNGYYYTAISLQTIFGEDLKNDELIQIIKDGNGKIWALSSKGLLAKQNESNEFKLLNNSISKDPTFKIKTINSVGNKVWLADNKGAIYTINISNYKSEIVINTLNKNIEEILISKTDNVFIRTNESEIFAFSIKKKQLRKLEKELSSYPEQIVVTLDNNDNLWIGTWALGIYSFKFKNEKFIENNHLKTITNTFSNNIFISMFCDSFNNIYFGTDGDGLYKLNQNNETLDHYKHNPGDRFSLNTNTVLNLNEDSNKNLWILTHYGNINILPFTNNNIDYYTGTESNFTTRVLSIHKNTSNDLWIGTSGNGITKIDSKNKKPTQYVIDKSSKKGFYAFTIQEDNNKDIWVGTYQNGIWIYNYKKDRFSKLSINDKKIKEGTEIRFLFKDSRNRMWVSSNTSLNVYNSNKKLLANFPIETHGLKGTISQSIIEDKNGTIWVAYDNGGLFKFKENSTNLQNSNFTKKPFFKELINENYSIVSMDTFDDFIWIIKNGKLHSYNITTSQFKAYSDYKSFDEIKFAAVKIEKNESLWLSSDKGVWHFNTHKNIVENYQLSDGFQSDFYMIRGAYKDDLGKIYFGGLNGLNAFYPKDLSKANVPIKLNVNSIEVLNKPAKLVIPEQINNGIENVKRLNLNYNQASISLRFAAIGNILNPNYYYAYRLKGFNNEWILSQNELKATYTNIPSGNYTFELKAGTKKGLWDIEIKEIQIVVKKPWWLKTWVIALYIVAGLLLLYGLYLWVKLKNKLTHEEIRSSQEKHIYNLKMDFFTKMSHEIQTPLTLILGPIEELLISAHKNGSSLFLQKLKIIYNNANRLSKIVSDLTTVRNKELGKLKLRVTKNNILDTLNEIAVSFNEQALSRNIDYKITTSINELKIWHDKDKIEHIFYNLLSNALKFTPKGGEINFNIQFLKDTKEIKVSIKDSGPGIPKEDLDKVFELFYQSNMGKQYKGSGIGLALTKELVELHHGSIKVFSNLKGTRFEVILPTHDDIYCNDEKLIYKNLKLNSLDNILKDNREILEDIFVSPNEKLKTILIVEDNYELQLFLSNVFKANFNIIVAEDGREGLEMAEKHIPTIIISDIMMPNLNGLEMCKQLHQNKVTSHIPIILLTAKNTMNYKIKGLKTGALEYINKPFNINELVLKVKNIITANEQLKSKYKREFISLPRTEISKSQDEVFLQKLVWEIETGIKDPDFKLQILADKMKISQTSLYRKCVALTGKTLVEFVRLLRLKKSAVVIAKYGYSISDAAYMVGFNDSKYFSKCFKKEYKVSPKAFQKEAKKRNVDEFLNEYDLKDSNINSF